MEFELPTRISHFHYCAGIFDVEIECPDQQHILVEYAIQNNIIKLIKKYIYMIKVNTKYCLMILGRFDQLSDETKKCLFESEYKSHWTIQELVFIRKNFRVEDIPVLAKINDFRSHEVRRLENSYGSDEIINKFYELSKY